MKKLIKPLLVIIAILAVCLLLIKPTLKKISFGVDLQGGFEILYNITPLEEGKELSEDDIQNTYKAIVNRIDTLGVSEPVISIEGENLIRIQLPGVSNEEEAREQIKALVADYYKDFKAPAESKENFKPGTVREKEYNFGILRDTNSAVYGKCIIDSKEKYLIKELKK